jgi:hypothetical protein
MGYYCEKEDCKCPHYYNHVCYINKCSIEEAKAFKCDCKPDIKDIYRYTSCKFSSGISYCGSNTRGYTDDGYYRNNYIY